jgi:acetolactate synthase I/III small subunit
MPARTPDTAASRFATADAIKLDRLPVLRLVVRNHPGVMSHVCGLFARRAFNVEGILCLPVGSGAQSVILLMVDEDERLEQLMRQLAKLEDVLEVRQEDAARGAFIAMSPFLG